MRLKNFWFVAAALALGACSSDEIETLATAEGNAFVQFTVKLPTAGATRSETTGDGTARETTAEGTEIGQESENLIKTVQVVLYDGSAYAKSVVFNTSGNVPAAGTDTYTTDPIKVEGLLASKKYTAYVIVNGALYKGSDIAAEAVTGITSVAGLTATGGIAEANKFLMTGKGTEDAVVTGDDVTVYTKDNPLDCGTIEVERAAARMDYAAVKTDNTYQLTKNNGELTVKLTGIALTNVSPSFYLFKRVSADGTATGWTIGGFEKGGKTPNYVVDYNWAEKTADNWDSFTNDYLNKYAGETSATYTDLTTLTTEDNEWSGTGDDRDYKIWTYLTENTIQADPTVNQINGLTTGVIFKGEISGTMTMYNSSDPAFDSTNPVYVLNGLVYGNWAAVLDAKAHSEADVLNAFSIGSLSDTEDDNDAAALKKAGFARYTPDSAGKYNTYYTYWNRHNDNGISNEMGVMEFAVVRNNVYKLAVTDISKLGHPNDPTNPGGGDPDPDDPDPENPDEDSSLYLKVSVKVLPWTVRKNDIKF